VAISQCYVEISVESTVRDHVNNVKRPFIQEIGIPDKVSTVYKPGHQPPFWLSTPVERAEAIVGRLISPSGKRTALLRETTSTPKKRFVEIWRGDCAELILETTTRHGAFYADGKHTHPPHFPPPGIHDLFDLISTRAFSDVLQSVFLASRGCPPLYRRVECARGRCRGPVSQVSFRCPVWRAVR